MMLDAFFVALAVFVGVAGHELFGMAMLSRPIVVAPLAGLLLGDVQTGLIVGASLESIFMGVVNIGISREYPVQQNRHLQPDLQLLLQLISEEMSEPLFQSFSHWQCLDYS